MSRGKVERGGLRLRIEADRARSAAAPPLAGGQRRRCELEVGGIQHQLARRLDDVEIDGDRAIEVRRSACGVTVIA